MTPQQLMDMPYAGMAKKELIAQGMWNHTITDEERIDWLQDNCLSMKFDEYDETWKIKTADFDCWYGSMRDDIDNAASAQEALTV